MRVSPVRDKTELLPVSNCTREFFKFETIALDDEETCKMRVALVK